MEISSAKPHPSEACERPNVVMSIHPPTASAVATVTFNTAVTMNIEEESDIKAADVNADADTVKDSSSSTSSLSHNKSNNQTNRPSISTADIMPITRPAISSIDPTPTADPLTTIRHHRPEFCNNQAQKRGQDQDRERHWQVGNCAPLHEPHLPSTPAAVATPKHSITFATATNIGFLDTATGSARARQLPPVATADTFPSSPDIPADPIGELAQLSISMMTTTTGEPASTFAFMQDPAEKTDMDIVLSTTSIGPTPGGTGRTSSASTAAFPSESESMNEVAGVLTSAPASSITIVMDDKTLIYGVDGAGALVFPTPNVTSTTATKKQVDMDSRTVTTPTTFSTVTQSQDEVLSTFTWCEDGDGACHEEGLMLTPTSSASGITVSLIRNCRLRSGCSYLTLTLTNEKGTTEAPIPTLPATPTLTTIDVPGFSISRDAGAASGSGVGGTGTNLDPASSSALSQSGGNGGWNAAKVIAPTVVTCVLLAAAVLWWCFRREKQKRIRKRMEEKAEWMKPEFGEMMRERMMQLDDSKTGKLGGLSEEGREEWFGARAEKGKKGLCSLSAIERELVSSGTVAAGSPVSSATKASSRVGEVSTQSSREVLTSVPIVKVDVRDQDTDGGFGWKVFKGRREIKSYQARKVGEGEGAGEGKWRRKWFGWYTK